MQEQWERWEPMKDLSKNYCVDSIFNFKKEFSMFLYDSDKKNGIKVIYENYIFSYRSTDESFRMKTINNLDEKYGTGFYVGWNFFKIKNSSYINDLKKIFKIADSSLIHFCFFDPDIAIDVIATYEPKIEILRNELEII